MKPFSIVENEGSQQLMNVIVPQYKFPSKTKYDRFLPDCINVN